MEIKKGENMNTYIKICSVRDMIRAEKFKV